MAERKRLAFGLRQIPDEVVTAWGARLIWPNDLLHDRQDMVGDEIERGDLSEWLNGGALKAALTMAGELADRHAITADSTFDTVLYEDERGVVVGNPQGSHGYLYVAAWLNH